MSISETLQSFNICNVGAIKDLLALIKRSWQSSQQGYVAKVPSLYTINLPSGESRLGIRKGMIFNSLLSSRAIFPCAKEGRLGRACRGPLLWREADGSTSSLIPRWQKARGLLGVHIWQSLCISISISIGNCLLNKWRCTGRVSPWCLDLTDNHQ